MRLTTSMRACMLGLAFAVIAMVAAVNPPSLQAQDCCGFGIYNDTPCAYRVILTTAQGDSVLAVPIGGYSYTVPDCLPFRLSVIDRCGIRRYLPTVIGDCVNVDLGAGCCLQICKISTCRWSTSVTHCLCPTY